MRSCLPTLDPLRRQRFVAASPARQQPNRPGLSMHLRRANTLDRKISRRTMGLPYGTPGLYIVIPAPGVNCCCPSGQLLLFSVSGCVYLYYSQDAILSFYVHALIEVDPKSQSLFISFPIPITSLFFSLSQFRLLRDGGPQRTTFLTPSVPVSQRHRYRRCRNSSSPQPH